MRGTNGEVMKVGVFVVVVRYGGPDDVLLLASSEYLSIDDF